MKIYYSKLIDSAAKAFVYAISYVIAGIFVELSFFQRIVFTLMGILWSMIPLIEFFKELKKEKKNE